MGQVQDKVAILTGAGDGIGRSMAVLFDQEGAKLVLAGRRREALEETAQLLRSEHIVVPTDVTKEEDCINLVRETVARFGQVDILLNNAAQPGKDHYIWEQTLENWNNTIAVDVTGPMLLSREALKQSMLERKSGVIINFSSYAAWNGAIRKSHYSVAKSGLRLLTKVTAMEAGPHGVRCNCLVPGATTTDLLMRFFQRRAGEEGVAPEVMEQRAAEATALKKLNTPEQIASWALFLCTDAASGMTGQSLTVDAGAVMVG